MLILQSQFLQYLGLAFVNYSDTSMAGTRMPHSPGLARTMVMVPTGHFMHYPPWMARTLMAHSPGLARTVVLVPTGQ